MITWAMKKIFGTSHDRAVRRMKPKVEAINRLEESMKKLSDEGQLTIRLARQSALLFLCWIVRSSLVPIDLESGPNRG